MRWNGGILDVGIFCVVDGGWVGGWESVKRQLTHSLTHSLQSVQPILKVFVFGYWRFAFCSAIKMF